MAFYAVLRQTLDHLLKRLDIAGGALHVEGPLRGGFAACLVGWLGSLRSRHARRGTVSGAGEDGPRRLRPADTITRGAGRAGSDRRVGRRA